MKKKKTKKIFQIIFSILRLSQIDSLSSGETFMATKAKFEMFFHLSIYLRLTWPILKSDHHGCKSENKFSFTCPW